MIGHLLFTENYAVLGENFSEFGFIHKCVYQIVQSD